MADEIRVGIIGANARGGWAGEAHVPAVQHLAGLTLAAVATSRQESADEAAHAFGAGKAYAGGAALIADPDIDLVTVATRVPDHHDLVLAAVAAGKHVYSEWPLGRGSAESEAMARAAAEADVHDAIGLQLRGSAAVKAARQRLASGEFGRILGISAYSSTAGFGPEVGAPFAYLEDPAAFANLVTIQGAHTLDLAAAIGGPLGALSALLSRQFPDIAVGDAHEPRRRQTYDHLLVQACGDGDVPVSVEVAGGRQGETPFWLEVATERGRLRLAGGAPRGLQSGRVTLAIDGTPVAIDEGEAAALPDPAANVAGLYAALRDDIRAGRRSVPDFAHATQLSATIERVFRSDDEGRRLAPA